MISLFIFTCLFQQHKIIHKKYKNMVFKVVRIDTPNPYKIQLPIGTHIIGRGKFLHNDDSDKRVSRNHAEMEVTGDSVTLKSTHRNPCFFKKRSTDQTQLLQLNCKISLCNGDKFGLIPDHFWYEVLHLIDQDITDESTGINENKENGLGNDETQRVEKTEENVADPLISSKLAADQESTQENGNVTPQVPSDTDPRPADKRSHDSIDSPVDVKKVKTEPVSTGDAAAGPSNDEEMGTLDPNIQVKNETAASPAKPNASLRERCIYGASCYRRNPQHKAQFSHPADGDWGAGSRGVCPYGRRCSRADPRHWAAHEHPPGVLAPDPARSSGNDPGATTPGVRQKNGKDKDSDSDEDALNNDLIVTGKRTRKTVNRQNWNGSESEGDEDPYHTDETDEWQPPSDVPSSQDYSLDF